LTSEKSDRELNAEMQRLMAEVDADAPPAAVYSSESAAPPAKTSSQSGTLAQIKANFFVPLWILAIPWTQEIIDQLFFGGQWNWILQPRSLNGIPGILLSAFSHSGFIHLISNTIGFAIFSWLILAKSRRDYWTVFLIGWLGGGAVSWLIGPTST